MNANDSHLYVWIEVFQIHNASTLKGPQPGGLHFTRPVQGAVGAVIRRGKPPGKPRSQALEASAVLLPQSLRTEDAILDLRWLCTGHYKAGVERAKVRLFQCRHPDARAQPALCWVTQGFEQQHQALAAVKGVATTLSPFLIFMFLSKGCPTAIPIHQAYPSRCFRLPPSQSCSIRGRERGQGLASGDCQVWLLQSLQGTSPVSFELTQICLHLVPNLLSYTKLYGHVDLGCMRKAGSLIWPNGRWRWESTDNVGPSSI